MIQWRLPELMRMRGVKSTAALHRKLVHSRGNAAGLSQAQVYRLAEHDGPDRLNLATLEALCTTLDTTPAELLTTDVDGVPNRLLRTLLVGFIQATAHNNLCSHARYQPGKPNVMMSHPGDPFGKILAWLWRSGRHNQAVDFVSDYLAEMRQHSPYAPDQGNRLTWDELRLGIRQAINTPYDLPEEEVAMLCDYLEAKIPSYYGSNLTDLNTP